MRSKIFYIAIFTVFLVSTVCFLPKNVCAKQNGVRVTFVCQNKTFVYDQSKIKYDAYDADTVNRLSRRGFFEDDKQKVAIAKRVQMLGFDVDVAVRYVLVGIDKVFDEIGQSTEVQKTDSRILFDCSKQNSFEYTCGKDGVCVDWQKLCDQLLDKLSEKSEIKIEVPTKAVKAVTKSDNIQKTKLKSFFETGCANSPQNRKDNLALALSKFNGMQIEPGEIVSFNKVVGKRTEQNGYKQAKVILNGKYVDGIGGGVCQASTTLYNGILLAGLQVDEWHRHTLKSNYVKPSFDAMVSDNGADLVFANNTDEKIYIKTECDGQSAKVWVYGVPNEYDLVAKSVVTKRIGANERVIVDVDGQHADKVTYDDESFCIQNGVDGLQSEGYLVAIKNGEVVWQKLLRKDNYAKVDKIVVKGAKQRQENEAQAYLSAICQA